jgi:deoxyribonuclease I
LLLLFYDRAYAGHRVTFYCGCGFDQQKRIALDGCGLGSLAGEKRAQRIEADHIFPAAQFGQQRPCWRDPGSFPACTLSNGKRMTGRACCNQVDPIFATAHNDLMNLVPAVGLINGKRSDFNWGMVSGGERFGTCAIRIDASIRRVQPPAGVRGDIARIMLYMGPVRLGNVA